MSPHAWLWLAVALCALVSLTDPAPRLRRWWRSKNNPQREQCGGEGAATAVVAPSPVAACGCELLVDRMPEADDAMVLGYYLSQASRAPEASA